MSTICSTIRYCTRPWSELHATVTSATNISGSDGSAKRLAEPETGLQISDLSVDKEYVLVVCDAWHKSFSTCSRRRSMSDATDAQYDWPCNALSCFKLATGGLDAKTQTKMLCQNDQGMSCGRADSFTHTFTPMCTGAFGLCSKVYIRLGTRGQQRRLDPHELFWNLSNESHRNTCTCTERVTVDGPLR